MRPKDQARVAEIMAQSVADTHNAAKGIPNLFAGANVFTRQKIASGAERGRPASGLELVREAKETSHYAGTGYSMLFDFFGNIALIAPTAIFEVLKFFGHGSYEVLCGVRWVIETATHTGEPITVQGASNVRKDRFLSAEDRHARDRYMVNSLWAIRHAGLILIVLVGFFGGVFAMTAGGSAYTEWERWPKQTLAAPPPKTPTPAKKCEFPPELKRAIVTNNQKAVVPYSDKLQQACSTGFLDTGVGQFEAKARETFGPLWWVHSEYPTTGGNLVVIIEPPAPPTPTKKPAPRQ